MFKRNPYFTLMLSFLTAFFSLYSVLLIKRGYNTYYSNWLFVIGALIYGVVTYGKIVTKAYDKIFNNQFVWLCLGICLISAFMLKLLIELPDIEYYYILFTILFLIPSLLVVVDDLINPSSIIKEKINGVTPKNALCFMGLVLFLLLLTWQKNVYYMHDTHIFYEQFEEMDSVLDLFDLEKLSLAGHVSIAYTFFGILNRLFWHSTISGLNVYAKVLLITGAYGYWKLMRFLYPGKNEFEYVLMTIVFSGSPYVLGLVTCNSYDYATWCIFPLLAYCIFAHKYIYAFVTSFYFVFCKEPCVVVYSFFLLGMYIFGCQKEKKVIHDVVHFVGLSTPCFLWMFSYLFVVHWDFSGGSIFSWSYVLYKLKSFIFINFNYLFAMFAIVTIVMTIKSYRNYLEYFIPIIVSAISFITLSFVTNAAGMMHARYIDSLIAQIFILASFVPAVVITNWKLKNVFYLFTVTISIVSSFWTIDPVSKLAYDTVNVGTTEIITTGGPVLSDAGVYNRQYQYFACVTDLAISDICIDDNNLIYMPAVDGITEYFNSLGFYTSVSEGDEAINTEYWNKKKETRMTDLGLEENEPFDVHFIVDVSPIEIPENCSGYYLYTEYAGKEIAESIASRFNVVSVVSFEKNGWIMNRMEFQE